MSGRFRRLPAAANRLRLLAIFTPMAQRWLRSSRTYPKALSWFAWVIWSDTTPSRRKFAGALRSRADVIIRGNHDAYAIGALGYPANRERAYRIQWTRNHLAGDTLDWLARLPVEASLRTRSGWRFVFRHANLDDEVGYVYPDTALNDSELDPGMTLVLGHTHHPMLRQAGRGRVLNSGSVGQPRDWRPGAAYALINTDNGQVTFHRVAYDIPAYQRRLREFGVEEELVAMLARQRADRRATAGDESGSAACIGREPTGLR